MSLTNKSAADIQAIIDAALSKKPALPKGLAEEIASKKAATEAKKAAKADAAAKEAAVAARQNQTISKTAAKSAAAATTATKLGAKAAGKRQAAEKKAKAKKATLKAAKGGSKAVVRKKRLDALQRLRLKEARKDRKAAKRSAALEGEGNENGEDDDEFDSDADGSLFDSDAEEEGSDFPFTDSDDEEDPEGAAALKAMRQRELAEKVLNKTICGGADKDALAEDPLAATFGGLMTSSSSSFFGGVEAMRDSVDTVDPTAAIAAAAAGKKKRAREEEEDVGLLRSLAMEKGQEYVAQDTLLADAHRLFADLSETERRRNAFARRKIAEMKAINKSGGDKDGFRYVLPTSVKSYARQLAGEGLDIPENLDSHFLGDGIQDTMKAPSRKKEKKKYHDDFYSFQIAKKWTRNAENFLSKAQRTKNLFINRQQRMRTTKKM